MQKTALQSRAAPTKYEDKGYCDSELDFEISETTETPIETPELCYEMCFHAECRITYPVDGIC